MAFLGLGKKKKVITPSEEGPLFPPMPGEEESRLDIPLVGASQEEKKAPDFFGEEDFELTTPPLPSGAEEMISEAGREEKYKERFEALPLIGEEEKVEVHPEEEGPQVIAEPSPAPQPQTQPTMLSTQPPISPTPQKERKEEKKEEVKTPTVQELLEELPNFTEEEISLAESLRETKPEETPLWTKKEKEKIEKAIKYPLWDVEELLRKKESPYIEAHSYLSILTTLKEIRQIIKELDGENKTSLEIEEEKDSIYDKIVNDLDSVQETCIRIEKEIAQTEE